MQEHSAAGLSPAESLSAFFDFILGHTPDSRSRAVILQASELPADHSIDTAVSVLGNGDLAPKCDNAMLGFHLHWVSHAHAT